MNNKVVATLVGFICSLIIVITPIMNLNTNIARLNVTMENMNKTILKMGEISDRQDLKIQDLEKRLLKLETILGKGE